MDLGLKDAAVCVSGGTKGLGLSAALAFAREGARVAVSGRDATALDAAVAALRSAGAADALGLRADVGRLDDVEAMFSAIDTRWGGLNTLVNMAGPTEPAAWADFMSVPDAAWQGFWDVGLMSVVRCTRAAVPLMERAGWGRVINISSISARLGLPFEAPYQTVKAGLAALSRNIAGVLAPRGILVNTVTPGVFRTEALRAHVAASSGDSRYDPDDLGQVLQWMRDVTGARHAGAIGRVALPAELDALLLLLGSRANSYIVGANIPVDGGSDYSIA